jgi:hypothetical protein
MRLAAAAAVLFIAASLSAQNFDERPVSTIAFAQNSEFQEAIGSDGRDFLIVGVRFPPGLVAHRLTAEGELLDGTGILITSQSLRVLGVFWGGDAYTIVMQGAGGIIVARIDGDGHLVDGPRVAAQTALQYDGAASSGERIVLAGRLPMVLDPQGHFLAVGPVVPSDGSLIGNYAVAWNGSGFMLTWSSSRPPQNYINVAPLDARGQPAGTFRKIIVATPQRPQIASDGNDYLVVWTEGAFTYAQHVSAAGEFLEKHSVEQVLDINRMTLLWNGSVYLTTAVVPYSTVPPRTPGVLRFDRTGVPLDAAAVSISDKASGNIGVVIAGKSADRVLMVWIDNDVHSFAMFLGSDAIIPLGITPAVQQFPRIACGRDNFAVAWQQGDAVYASRLSYDGSPLDGPGIRLSANRGSSPRVVFDGRTYVIAWMSARGIVTAHLAPDGTLLNTEMPALASDGSGFDLATDGESALVVAVKDRLIATRVHRDGIAEPPVAVSPAGMSVSAPHAAWGGGEYLVGWIESIVEGFCIMELCPIHTSLRAARISPSLALLDPEPLRITPLQYNSVYDPLVASNGRDFMAAWSNYTGIHTRFIAPDGSMGGTVDIAPTGETRSMVWDGLRYAVAFDLTGKIFFAHIGSGSPSLISASADPEGFPDLASPGNGAAIAAYQRQASEAPYGSVSRVFVKGLVPQPRIRAIR